MIEYFLNNGSVNDWFTGFWQLGESVRYRIVETTQTWFTLSDFELFPGLVFGDTTILTDETKQTLKTLGIYHALSASGSNVAVIQQCARFLTIGTSRQSGLATRIACTLLYLICVGQAAPILRAVVVRIYLESGRFFHLQTHPLFAWLFAAITLAVIRPQFLTELSFQLSALAALGICIFLPKESKDNLSQLGALAAQFREAFWQTAAAQFFVVPVLVLILGDSPTSALLVNTITAPILSILTWQAFILAGFGALYGFLQAYNLMLLQLFIHPVWLLVCSAYRLTNQSFNWVLDLVYQDAQFLNGVVPVWVMMGCLVLVFAVRLGKLRQRVKFPPSLLYQWSHIAHEQ